MKNKCISIKRLKVHEFHTTLRRMHPDNNTWTQRFEITGEIEERAIQQFIRLCGPLVLSYLILTSLRTGRLLSIKVQTFEASVPVAFFFTLSSFLFLLTIVAFCHLSVAMTLKANESGKIVLSGFSTNIYGLLKGKENDYSLGLTQFTNFIVKERLPVSSFLGSAILLGLLASLIPLGAFGYYSLIEQAEIFLDEGFPLVERVSALLGSALIALSFLYVTLFHIPLPTTKNTSHLRWLFLRRLWGRVHPRENFWRGEE